MKTPIQIVKEGIDHVELQVENEAAADLVADEAHKRDIKPVIGVEHFRACSGGTPEVRQSLYPLNAPVRLWLLVRLVLRR